MIPGLSRCAPLQTFVGEPGDPDSVRFAGGGGPGIPEAGGRDAVVAVGGNSLGWLGGVCADFLEELLTAPMEVRSLCVVTL